MRWRSSAMLLEGEGVTATEDTKSARCECAEFYLMGQGRAWLLFTSEFDLRIFVNSMACAYRQEGARFG